MYEARPTTNETPLSAMPPQWKEKSRAQKAFLKQQGAQLAALQQDLERDRGELAGHEKTIQQLRAEWKVADTQREEQGKRAGVAEQKRTAALAEVAKLQQAAEAWQAQRAKATAKYNQLRERLAGAKVLAMRSDIISPKSCRKVVDSLELNRWRYWKMTRLPSAPRSTRSSRPTRSPS
jgi:DNA repair exonuclease SbcCD ATPase subunit